MTVTAHLVHGAAIPARFPVPLDGVLASAQVRRDLGNDYWDGVVGTPPRAALEADPHGTRGDPAVAAYRSRFRTRPLPLARVGIGGKGPWVWAATCATPDSAEEDVRWWHGRFDDMAAERVVTNLPADTTIGFFKGSRMPLVVTIAGTLTWRAAGDPQGVVSLLGDIECLGKKAAQGEGVVSRWDVRDDGPARTDAGSQMGAVLHQPDGTPARPIPRRMAKHVGYADAELVPHTVRPPYWRAPLRDNGARSLDMVVAPWAVRQPEEVMAMAPGTGRKP